jgi:hypothetical protein
MTTGWIVVSFFTMFVGLSMAEIVSAIPVSNVFSISMNGFLTRCDRRLEDHITGLLCSLHQSTHRSSPG